MQNMDDIYRKYADTVYRFLLAQIRDSEVAEELTQETFYQAIRSIGKYDESCRISTWLCAIAKNVLFTYRRKNPEHDNIEDIDALAEASTLVSAEAPAGAVSGPQGMSAEDRVLSSLERVELFRMLHLLKDPFKEVMYLRIFGDLPFREIGEILGKTENWARVTFYRGKEMLRRGLKDAPADSGGS